LYPLRFSYGPFLFAMAMQFKDYMVSGAATAGGLFNEQATFHITGSSSQVHCTFTTIWVQLAAKGI